MGKQITERENKMINLIKLLLVCLLLSGCSVYKNNKLQKQIYEKQQSWLNI
jgi:uncharacterized lipoprotein